MINNTDTLYPEITAIPYPKAGETNSACRVGVIPSGGGDTTWINVPGDPRNHYIAHLEWADSVDEIIFQHLNRRQNLNNVYLADIHSGNSRLIFSDRDRAWVEVNDDIRWFKKGKWFTWISERDGWRHLYTVSRSGHRFRLITRGDFDVISIESIDTRRGWVYFIASPDNPGQRYLYRTRLNGRGRHERISPRDQAGTHSYQISPDSNWAFHTFSNFTTPPTVSLIRLPSHEPVRTLVDNRDLKKKIAGLDLGRSEFFRLDVDDGINLDAWMITPPDFDSTTRYPVLFYVYGEPWGQTVLDRWGRDSHLWHHMLAQQGYIVISVDNRGTSAPRGREWRKCIYGQIGILASADQAAAARAIINRFPFVDASRIGIWGWSGGGSMSLNAIFRYPEIYHTAMAVAFVSNQRFYDTIYQERYMGRPQDNPDGYRNGSPITHAHRLKGNLLLVHGTGDDNVHYQNCESLVNELIKHNKHFTMMAYPNRSHSISEGKNTSRHLFELLTRYLRNHLPAGGRRPA
jgi:dipeptidyl-peptidase-4